MKKYKNYLILVIAALLFIFLSTGTFNVFGSNTDWLNQHTIFPEYFRQLFYETKELIPNITFNYGGGQNIFNISYYGLLNPLLLPSYFLPFVNMTTYIIILNILVVITSSILFYKFLKSHKFSDDTALTVSLLFTFAIPLIFHMHRHIMFVNYMPFLIMSFMGVDKYIDNNKKCFLILSIFLMIMTSYYYSVAGIVAIFIYYLYRHINKGFNLKEVIKFIIVIIIPILMSCVLLLPTLYTLISGRNDMHKSFTLDLFIPRLRINGLLGDVDSIGLGLIALVALIYLFFTKKKQNIIIGTIISAIIFIPIFAYILNGGLYTKEKCFITFIPLFCFLIANLIEDIFKKKVNIKNFAKLVLVISLFILIFISHDKKLVQIPIILLSFILFDKYDKKILIKIPLILIALNMAITSSFKEEKISTNEYNKIFDKNVENEITEVLDDDNYYYRFANMHYNLKTINKIYNNRYYTTNIYSSTYNKDYLDFNRNEFLTNRDDYNYFLIPSNVDPLYNTFMGVKYIYSKEELKYPYKKISENIYENTNAFPIIYASNSVMNIDEFNTYGYPYKNYILLNSVVVDDKSNYNYNDINVEKLNINYKIISNDGVEIEDNTLKVNKKGKLVVELEKELKDKILFIEISGLKENSCKESAITMSINNISNSLTCKKWPYPNKNNTFHFTISDSNIKTLEIELTKGTYNIENVNMYIIDNKDIINNDITRANIKSIFKNKITSSINIDEDQYLVTSIPYDRGFTIKIDGEIVEKQLVNKAFLGAKIEKGNHEVEIIYNSPLLKEGKIISLIGITIFIVLIYKERKHVNI